MPHPPAAGLVELRFGGHRDEAANASYELARQTIRARDRLPLVKARASSELSNHALGHDELKNTKAWWSAKP